MQMKKTEGGKACQEGGENDSPPLSASTLCFEREGRGWEGMGEKGHGTQLWTSQSIFGFHGSD